MATEDFNAEQASTRLKQSQEKDGTEDKQESVAKKEISEKEQVNGVTKDVTVIQSPPGRGLLYWVIQLGPFKLLANVLRRLRTMFTFSNSIQNVGMADHYTVSPERRSRTAKKRLGCFTRFLLSVLPYRLQNSLGYPVPSSMGITKVPDDIRQSPTKPHGKGSKRKQDETESSDEEQYTLVEFIKAELPEEDEDDPSYEPSTSKSNLDSEQSKNDTESDLEVEEKDGMLQLKEHPTTIPEPIKSNLDSEEKPNDAESGTIVEEKDGVTQLECPTTVPENTEGTLENQ